MNFTECDKLSSFHFGIYAMLGFYIGVTNEYPWTRGVFLRKHFCLVMIKKRKEKWLRDVSKRPIVS